MYEIIKVTARIELFSGKDMRQIPIVSKYRPLFHFRDSRTLVSGSIDLIKDKELLPGKSGIVYISFIRGVIKDECFNKGETFTFTEGGKFNLGRGEIIEIITI
jgi:translation elongation factor EF-Tu-like GTPase